MRGSRLAQKIEIAAGFGLQHALHVKARVAAVRHRREWTQGGAAFGKFVIADQKIEAALRHRQFDAVTVLYQRQRATDRGFWRDMQHDGAVGGALSASARSNGASRSTAKTLTPRLARRRTEAAPIPPAAPVTTTFIDMFG